jgi:hypothetical protein
MPHLGNPAYRFLLTFLLLCSGVKASLAQPASEYQVKAAFLLNFTHFVEWPLQAFQSAQSPMVIGIYGKDPFGRFLPQIISGEKAGDRSLVTKVYSVNDDISTCQMLFINAGKKETETAITKLKGRNILTISDNPDFLRQGGMIRFFTRNNKIQLEINPDAMKSVNLVISSALLRQVDIFIPKNNL